MKGGVIQDERTLNADGEIAEQNFMAYKWIMSCGSSNPTSRMKTLF
jgi:hypothetical protein